MPPVHVDKEFDQPEADAQPSLGAARPLHLAEHLEDGRQGIGGNTHSVVAHQDHDAARIPFRLEQNFAASRGVLGAVVEEVVDDLCDARRVGVQPDRFVRHDRAQGVSAGRDRR